MFFLFETGGGILAYGIFLIGPFFLLGLLIYSIILWKKAQKTGDKKAKGYIIGNFIVLLSTILLALKILYQD